MKKIYLAGAMGCYKDHYEYMLWRKCIEDALSDKANVFNPAYFYNYENKLHKTEKEIMDFELHNLRQSDVVVLNVGRIHESVGTIMEVSAAKELRIPIIAFGTENQINQLHPWLFNSVMRFETDINQLIAYIEKYFINT